MNLKERLEEKGIKVVELQNEGLDFRKKWEQAFASSRKSHGVFIVFKIK